MARPIPEPSTVWPIGTRYSNRAKMYVCTVTDILRTYNAAGELVAIRYEASHEYAGQTVTDSDVVATTIARNLIA